MALIENIVEKRQNKEQGSSLELILHLKGQPEYDTAGNVAVWPANDPAIVN